MSQSKKRMILVMFQKDVRYFPSMREIRDELILAQVHQIHLESKQWNRQTLFGKIKESYVNNWNILFELANLENFDKPLTTTILSNPDHNITKHILYLYSMESFIYGELNQASREKDETKIKYYGAFAAALSYIIYKANENRVNTEGKLTGVTKLYRGLKLKRQEVQGQ